MYMYNIIHVVIPTSFLYRQRALIHEYIINKVPRLPLPLLPHFSRVGQLVVMISILLLVGGT